MEFISFLFKKEHSWVFDVKLAEAAKDEKLPFKVLEQRCKFNS